VTGFAVGRQNVMVMKTTYMDRDRKIFDEPFA
jgi:hypothetical protein